MKHKYDYLVVGSGLFGAVFANKAKMAGKKILIIDKRNNVGGNVYTENIQGINVHKYGAHIFHTNNKVVWDYINKYASFNRFINTPIAVYKNEIYSLPFNMFTFNKLWGVKTPQEALKIINNQRHEIKHKPQNLEEQAISTVGRDIFEKLIKGYTEKQWGRLCSNLPSFIIKRIPIRLTFNNNYFDSIYQGIPVGGYTNLINNLLSEVEIKLNADYFSNRNYFDSLAPKIIFTGSIDQYFDYKYGVLQYRTLKFEEELLNIPNYQGNAVVNYTEEDIPFTRIIEHKWFEFGKDEFGNDLPNTIISKEYSCDWNLNEERYYPINDKLNNQLYNKYKALSKKEKKVIFGGRLGEYKYYDMDQVIASSLNLCEKELFNNN